MLLDQVEPQRSPWLRMINLINPATGTVMQVHTENDDRANVSLRHCRIGKITMKG